MRLKKKNRSSTPRYWIKFQNKNLIKWSTSDINRCIHIDNSKKSLERENKTLNSVFWFLCLFGRSVANGAADQRRSRWIRSSGNLRVLQIYRYTHRERQGDIVVSWRRKKRWRSSRSVGVWCRQTAEEIKQAEDLLMQSRRRRRRRPATLKSLHIINV